jgi:adenylate cyclase
VPQYDDHDGWTPPAVRNATVVARRRARGRSLSPLMRSGATGVEVADEMRGLAEVLLPVSSPVMNHADLTGYTRLTEEAGELEALDAVERFIQAVAITLPDEARVVKTIGDEVMIVSADPTTLTDWAVGFQGLQSERPLPRIGIHVGNAIYRDGDYFGRDVNISARVAARSAGGEVLVTRPVVERAGSHLEFDRVGEIKLKGFSVSTEMFVARLTNEEE